MVQRLIKFLCRKGLWIIQRRLRFNRMTQVHQHDHAKLCGDACQRDESCSGGNGQMKAHPVQEPDPADQGERNAGNDQQRFPHPTKRQIQQNENNHQRHRHHQLQLMAGAFKQLKLPGKRHAGSRFQLHLFRDRFFQIVNYRHHVTIARINIDPACRSGIFGFQHRRSWRDLHVRHIRQGNLLLHWRQNRQLT